MDYIGLKLFTGLVSAFTLTIVMNKMPDVHKRNRPEFTSPLFFGSYLECALEDESYEDGSETQVDCNRCVCACGNWVCTAMTCDGGWTRMGRNRGLTDSEK